MRVFWKMIHQSLAILLVSLWMSSSALVAESVSNKVSAAYLTEGLSDLGFKDGRMAFSMWMQELSGKEGIELDIRYYDSPARLLSDFQSSQVKLIGLNPFFYLHGGYQAFDASAEHVWAAQIGEGELEKMLLLVRKDSDIESLSALKGKRIACMKDNLLARVFLDTELLKDQQRVSDGFIKEMIKTTKSSTAILKTYFGKVDASIVPEFAFRLAIEMNPSLGKELSILSESPEIFMPILLFTHKDTDERLYRAFHRNAMTLEQSARGRNILALFKIKRLFVLSDDALLALKEYYGKYLSLKQKYGVDDE